MRKYLLFILLIACINAWSQKTKKVAAYKTIKTLYTDLNNDGKIDTIILSDNGSDGDFNRITVKLAGFQKKTFKAKQYWASFDSLFLKKDKNLVHSNLLFIKKTDKHAAILLSGGTDGAGYSIEFSIINIENNRVKMVFDHDDDVVDVELPTELTDLENNGRLDFVYRITFQCSTTIKKGMICAYSPYFVYPVDDSCKLNKPLMKAYNIKHYVFDGYKYSEDIKIYYPNNNGRPSIWHHAKNQQ